MMAPMALVMLLALGFYGEQACAAGPTPYEFPHLNPRDYKESYISRRENTLAGAEPYHETLRTCVKFHNASIPGNVNAYRVTLAYYMVYLRGGPYEKEVEMTDSQSFKDVYAFDTKDRTEIINIHTQNYKENLYYNKQGGQATWSELGPDDEVAVIHMAEKDKPAAGAKPTGKPVTVNMPSVLKVTKESILLDKNTANPILTICSDGAGVKAGAFQNLPDNPERFDSLPCVLGSKAISSGKHYWEVRVLDQPCSTCIPGIWIIGVAKQQVRRKGRIHATQDEGIYVLQYINLDLGGLSVPFDVLNEKSKPRLLGVYLDYDAGELSFYNAECGTLIYSIKNSFKEPLLPLLCSTHSVELSVI